MVILENIDNDIDIDKAILQNIDIDKLSNRFKFGISNRASRAQRKGFNHRLIRNSLSILSTRSAAKFEKVLSTSPCPPPGKIGWKKSHIDSFGQKVS